jgi:putative ABC transport system permease protein
MSIVVKTRSDPQAVLGLLRQTLQAADRDVAVFDVRTVADTLGLLLTPIRLTAVVLGTLGALGLGIAMLGVYGVVSYVVSQRTREFGIRKALGADDRELYSVVLGHTGRMLALGVVPGLVAAWIAAGYLRHLLYGIAPRDPATFAAVPIALGVAGLAASYRPARRAATVEPSVTLRDL